MKSRWTTYVLLVVVLAVWGAVAWKIFNPTSKDEANTVPQVRVQTVPKEHQDTLLLVEADYRMKRAFAKYATGVWPCGEYGEEYGWGRVVVKLTPYRDFPDLQVVEVKVFINGSDKRLGVRQIIAFEE